MSFREGEKHRERARGGEREKNVFEPFFLNARSCFCALIDTVINHPEGLLSLFFDQPDKSGESRTFLVRPEFVSVFAELTQISSL